MGDISVKIPKVLEEDKAKLEKKIGELVMFEAKRKELLKFVNENMKGAGQVTESELVSFGRRLKKGRFRHLKKQGLA